MPDRQALDTDTNGVIFGDNPPDYAGVDVPATKPREEFSVEERRAELLGIITQLGHPSRVNQTELADRYGVSQPMIHKDLNELADHVSGRVGDRHDLEIESVFRRSIQGLLDEEEWRKAAQTAADYSEWMTQRSDIDDLREEVELLKQAANIDQ